MRLCVPEIASQICLAIGGGGGGGGVFTELRLPVEETIPYQTCRFPVLNFALASRIALSDLDVLRTTSKPTTRFCG